MSGLIGSCVGGMLAATMPDEQRGKAGGWVNAGNLIGGAVGGFVGLHMTQIHATALQIGLTVSALMIAPALVALFLVDGPHVRRPARERFSTMLTDVGRVIRSRPGWTGILFCLSPVGTAALVNLFTGMARDFRIADDDPTVKMVNGAGGAVLTAIGALAGGYLCDRMNRRLAYLLSGALTAACGLAMAAFPLDRTNYIVGVSSYLLISGFCYAAFSAVVLEAIGRAGDAASTQYTLFSSAGNAAIAYVGKLDTVWSGRFGPKAPLGADALLNLAGIGLLTLMLLRLRARDRQGAIVSA
jgi:MFS transporter, PAT family, beta-lactamase induction signal transducer AmpG